MRPLAWYRIFLVGFSMFGGPFTHDVFAGTRVIDGDTIEVDGVKIRIEEIDTPETWRSRCARELEMGLVASARMKELLAGKTITYVGTKLDYWGRTLATVYADGVDVGKIMMEEGLAVRYRKGPKAKAERLALWCPVSG